MADKQERLNVPESMGQQKESLITDVRNTEAMMPNEVKRWMDLRREEIPKVSTPPAQTSTQQSPVLTPAAPQTPKIVIPTTRATFGNGFKKAITEAGRWFSVFLFRMIKMKKGTIVFKDEDV